MDEILRYLRPVLRWWWLMAIAAVLAGVSAFFFTQDLPPTYNAVATLQVGRTLTSTNPNSGEYELAARLANTYANLAYRSVVVDQVKQTLNLEELPRFEARPQVNGQLLDIAVTDSSAEMAAAVANALAYELIRQVPMQGDTARQDFVQNQLNRLQADIIANQGEVDRLQIDLGSARSASELAALREQQRLLNERAEQLQTNYARLLSSTSQGANNTLSVYQEAFVPTVPQDANRWLVLGLAVVGAMTMAAAFAYLIEYLDNTLRRSEDIGQLLPYPVVGSIAEMRKSRALGMVSIGEELWSPAAEAFRALRTNLEFAAVDAPIKTILVTSAQPGDGKSSVAYNLALMIARGDKRVVLLDADLRRSSLNELPGLSRHAGLSDVFRNRVTLHEAGHVLDESTLTIIPSGTPPPNPTELLASRRMNQVLQQLSEEYDVVIVDGPPFLVSDAWVLASKVDGVLVVVRPGYTPRQAARVMAEQLRRVNARVLGVTLNRVRRGRDYYMSNYAMSNYYGGLTYANEAAISRENRAAVNPMQAMWQRIQAMRPPHGKERGMPVAAEDPARHQRVEVMSPTLSQPNDQRARASADVLYALSRQLAAQMDLTELLTHILQMTMQSVGAASGSIIVLDDTGNIIEGAMAYAGKVHKQTAEQLADVVRTGLAGWVIEHRQAALVPDTGKDPRWVRRTWQEQKPESRSAISVPLLARDRVVGVLTLVHPQTGQFNRDDLSTLTAIAVGISFNQQISRETTGIEN